MPAPPDVERPYAFCPPCGKWSYTTRKVARRAAKRFSGRDGRLSQYACQRGNGWHNGHLPKSVRHGKLGRGELYNKERG